MIRLVGLQLDTEAGSEFLLLQNQGSMRQHLRGHAVAAESAFDQGPLSNAFHLFSEDIYIPSGAFVMLRSDHQEPRWARTRDGALLFITGMSRTRGVWVDCPGVLHVLCTQHSLKESTAVCSRLG